MFFYKVINDIRDFKLNVIIKYLYKIVRNIFRKF